jgi:acetolactate synthase I/II/III large subunit
MIRVADYIAGKLAEYGVKHIFMITGGGAMFLDDAIGKEKRLQYVCDHHEQACAIAAEGYARVKEGLAVVCVTTGPGGTNALTGVLGQWLDSVPVLYISGQVRYDTTIASTGLPLRQLGDQEANIVEIVKSITKYAVMVTDPQSIQYHLGKAIELATSGRQGPVWLDIPLNVQSSMIDETKLEDYSPERSTVPAEWEKQVKIALNKIREAERPLIMAGAGIRLSGAADRFFDLAEKMGVPVQVAWDAIDLFPSDHTLYAGRPSTLGQRGANFIFQNADLILSIGCRLNVRQIGYTFPAVARSAYKIAVDIDKNELIKPTIKIDLPINADAGAFIKELAEQITLQPIEQKSAWLQWCKERIQRYPAVLPEYKNQNDFVNPYVFSEALSECLKTDEIVVSSNGASCVIPIQAMKIKHGQRHIVNSGCAAMGYGLPAAIGACFANGKQRVICLEGDGSIQLNIQELETVKYHNLPLKIFLFNNAGYLSIRTTQNNFFNGNFVGEGSNSGVGFPDFGKIAKAYGIKSFTISSARGIKKKITDVLEFDGPTFCNVKMDPNQLFMPRISSKKLPDGRMVSSPLEDMYPFLDDEEFLSNMLISRWQA